MKVSFNFATVASLMVVPPLSTSVPKLGFVQVAEGGTIEPRSIIQDRELSTWNIYRMKGSKKNTAAPTPAPVAAPSPAPVEPVPGQKGPTELCNECDGKIGAEYSNCWLGGVFKLAGFTHDPYSDASRRFQQLTFQKPKPTEPRAIGGNASSWGGLTPVILDPMRTEGTPWERSYAQSNTNEVIPSKIVYKQSLDDPNYNTYNIPYDNNFKNTNETFLKIDVNFPILGNCSIDKRSIHQEMKRLSTDGIMVIKDGKILAEHYKQAFNLRTRHRAFSMTKSLTGVILAMLIEKGYAKYDDLVTQHVPQLNVPDGAFQGTTIGQVMDMSNDYTFLEGAPPDIDCNAKVAEEFHCAEDPSEIKTGAEYAIFPGCESMHTAGYFPELPDRVSREFHLAATRGLYARPPGPQSFKDGLLALKRDDTHLDGEKFTYRSANTNVLGWIIENLVNNKGMEWFSDNIWSKLKQNSDLLMILDQRGFPGYFGGAQYTLKDSARLGEMMRNGGRNYNGDEVVPEAIVKDIMKGGGEDNRQQFANGPNGNFNCVFSTTIPQCEQFNVCNPGSQIVENNPVSEYLKAIGEPYEEGITSGMAYRNQWWVLPGHTFGQQGVHGQFMTVFPKVNMTIATFSSQVNANELEPDNYMMMFTIAAHYANYEPK